MKFIKYAVGLVIALSVIPLVVVTVNSLETHRLTVEFEVLDVNGNTITFSDNTYTDIVNNAISDSNHEVINLKSLSLNNDIAISIDLYEDVLKFNLEVETSLTAFTILGIDNTNVGTLDDGRLVVGDIITITFEVPRPLPPLVKLLVGFIPMLLAGGILLFMLNKRKFE